MPNTGAFTVLISYYIIMSKFLKILFFLFIIESKFQGQIQNFLGGGGGGAQKIMCSHAHQEREVQSPLWPESRAHLKGPGAYCIKLEP